MSASYPTRYRRTALAPALLATIALLAGVLLIESDGFIAIRFVVSILAIIVAVFAWQARQWWWLVPLGAIAVLWNPVLPITLDSPDVWLGLQYIAAVVFIVVGLLVRVIDDSKRA